MSPVGALGSQGKGAHSTECVETCRLNLGQTYIFSGQTYFQVRMYVCMYLKDKLREGQRE